MASSESRLAVVDALALVPGVSATATMPDTPVAGAAWPVWAESRFTTGKLAHPIAHSYDVRVLLPAGYLPDTVDAADGLVESVMNALRTVGTVDVAQPITVLFDTGPNPSSMPGITVRVLVTAC